MNRKSAFKFMDKHQVIYLSTIGRDGSPQTRAIINIRNKDAAPHLRHYFQKSDRVFYITNAKSDKMAEIRKNKSGSVYAHDGGDYGMLLTGTLTEVTDPETKQALWTDYLDMYYPGGPTGDEFGIIEFIPKTFKTYQDDGMIKRSGDIIDDGQPIEEP